jgi:hypothetical protein
LIDYVFGYASLVGLQESLKSEIGEYAPVLGRLHGFRRHWGVAMNNWEEAEGAKHWLDRETGERPRIRVAYLDIYERKGSAVNGLALPVDAARLAAFDAREINYRRIEVSDSFEGDVSGRIFTYVGLDAARLRCRLGIVDGDIFVSRDYFAGVRRAFKRLGLDALDEFDRTTDVLSFPERDLLRARGPSR